VSSALERERESADADAPDRTRPFARRGGSDTSHSVQYYKRRPRASERLAHATIDFITTSSNERRGEPRADARLGYSEINVV